MTDRPIRKRLRPAFPALPPDPVAVEKIKAEIKQDPFDLSGVSPVLPGERLSDNIAARARQIGRLNNEYAAEFILQQLHKLILARVPKDLIAQRFGVSTRTIYQWENELFKRLKAEAQKLDPVSFLGESLEFYRHLRAESMSHYLTREGFKEKMMALEQARGANNDMHRFLQAAGFYEQVKFQPEGARSVRDEELRLANELAEGAKDIVAAFRTIDMGPLEPDGEPDMVEVEHRE